MMIKAFLVSGWRSNNSCLMIELPVKTNSFVIVGTESRRLLNLVGGADILRPATRQKPFSIQLCIETLRDIAIVRGPSSIEIFSGE